VDRVEPLDVEDIEYADKRHITANGRPDAAFCVLSPLARTSPLIFNSPHSGTDYPEDLIASSGLDRTMLRRSEDSFVDLLFEDAPQHGAPLLKALFPRAYLDVNREPFELDPLMFEDVLPDHVNTRSLRVAAGFGTIPRVVAEGMAIYRKKLPFSEAERRVAALYHPYHNALSGLLSSGLQQFGCTLLIDCHSMPSAGAPSISADRRAVDIILGDRYGTSCAPLISQTIEEILRGQGYQVVRNSPYAGGYITDCYGRPGKGQHAVQIEINRALYMDESQVAPTGGFARVKQHMSDLIAVLSQRLTPELIISSMS
jgi:N-formylglutamate amidohydrolase